MVMAGKRHLRVSLWNKFSNCGYASVKEKEANKEKIGYMSQGGLCE